MGARGDRCPVGGRREAAGRRQVRARLQPVHAVVARAAAGEPIASPQLGGDQPVGAALGAVVRRQDARGKQFPVRGEGTAGLDLPHENAGGQGSRGDECAQHHRRALRPARAQEHLAGRRERQGCQRAGAGPGGIRRHQECAHRERRQAADEAPAGPSRRQGQQEGRQQPGCRQLGDGVLVAQRADTDRHVGIRGAGYQARHLQQRDGAGRCGTAGGAGHQPSPLAVVAHGDRHHDHEQPPQRRPEQCARGQVRGSGQHQGRRLGREHGAAGHGNAAGRQARGTPAEGGQPSDRQPGRRSPRPQQELGGLERGAARPQGNGQHQGQQVQDGAGRRHRTRLMRMTSPCDRPSTCRRPKYAPLGTSRPARSRPCHTSRCRPASYTAPPRTSTSSPRTE